MKFNVVQFITNTKGQHTASILATFDDKEKGYRQVPSNSCESP